MKKYFSQRAQRMIKTTYLLCVLFVIAAKIHAQGSVSSPDGKIKVTLTVIKGNIYYNISYNNKLVLQNSRLGITATSSTIRGDYDFSKGMRFKRVIDGVSGQYCYEMNNAKKSKSCHHVSQKSFEFENKRANKLSVIFDVSNNGVAFHYYLDRILYNLTISNEATSFHFMPGTKAWLQPMSKARSGWEHSNPSYEEHYLQGIPVNTSSPLGAGWVYPALFKSDDTWLLITETWMADTYCASRLSTVGNNILKVAFPDTLEAFTGGRSLPTTHMYFYTPWRIIAIGSLKTIVESTIGTDYAMPASSYNDYSFVKPGKASWSWIMSKDEHITYDEQKKYIDFAADMNWQYCLIDVNWDTKIGYEKIKELADYAKTKNVGLILWYNSSGDWNTTKYHPKSALLTKEQRDKEFGRLQQMGIKGIKVDFFGGDGQSMIKYYIDILKDAERYKLLVNFHGATLPRGWHRTYPHLLTTEAVRGFEMVTFGQEDADKQATHCTILPFTRNAFDPMDFTPMNLYKVTTKSIRKTSSAFELALSVLFLSGIQHFAESPEGMAQVPVYVKTFLQELPVSWDDVRFIDGFPGKEVIIARRSGDKWYVAGINGEWKQKTWTLDLSFLKGKKATIITDGAEDLSFTTSEKTIPADGKMVITIKPNGGFVVIVE